MVETAAYTAAMLSIILQAGDVERNPGPTDTPFCGGCGKRTRQGQPALECGVCNTGWHKQCSNLTRAEVARMVADGGWVCPVCDGSRKTEAGGGGSGTTEADYTATEVGAAVARCVECKAAIRRDFNPVLCVGCGASGHRKCAAISRYAKADSARTWRCSNCQNEVSRPAVRSVSPPVVRLLLGKKCDKCKRSIRATSRPLMCVQCEAWYHVKCARQERGVLEILRNNNIWKCEECDNESTDEPKSDSDNQASNEHQRIVGVSGNIKESISIMQWNCDGVWRKKHELEAWLVNHRPDVVLLQETKLRKIDETPMIRGYACERKDRTEGRRNNAEIRGGGLITLIKKGIPYVRSDNTDRGITEKLAIALLNGNDRMYITNIYIPPVRNNGEDQRGEMLNLESIKVGRNCFVGGDFNAHNELWDSISARDARGTALEDWMDDNEMTAINDGTSTQYNRVSATSSAPDVSFVSCAQEHQFTWKAKNVLASDHLPIVIKWQNHCAMDTTKRDWRYNYNKAKWSEFVSISEQQMEDDAEWDKLSIKQFYEKWQNKVLLAASTSIPMKRSRDKYIIWMNDDIKVAIRQRNEARKYNQDRECWKEAEDKVQGLINKARGDMAEEAQDN